jgi:two-component system phosphate regulon sensor histidine kinase PhoR
MNKQNYKWVVYFIGFTIAATIAVQVYWNYREYQINKLHLISKVQLSLDNSVEAYYANITRSGIITYASLNPVNSNDKTDTIIVSTNSRENFRKKIDSTLQNLAKNDTTRPLLINNQRGSVYPFFTSNHNIPKNIDSLISKVMVSISRDTLNLEKLDTYLAKELNRNNLAINYAINYTYGYRDLNDSLVEKTKTYKLENFPNKYLTVLSNSTFLSHRSKLQLYFTNETVILLRNSFISIILSFLLSISIIASLVFLLKTIYKQKQLAEVKNDLINNITHEFKTPIATISAALEALKNFNALNDKAKSEKYIAMANSQAIKLYEMVEKILETASLNHNDLVFQKKPIHLAQLIERVIEKYQLISTSKKITFENSDENIILALDQFHFENALGNIIDNAIKYGGNNIDVSLKTSKNKIQILIKDDGIGIPKSQKDKIFDQFYRIPTGNTHNIKGFGIGLFYTKSIVEKHQGSIEIIYDKNNNTLFKIELLNE